MLGCGSLVYLVTWSPHAARIASASGDKSIKIWAGDTGSLIATLTGHNMAVSCISFCPENPDRMVSGSWDKTIKIWSIASASCEATLSGHTNYVLWVAFSPNASMIASGSADKTLRLWCARTLELKTQMLGERYMQLLLIAARCCVCLQARAGTYLLRVLVGRPAAVQV